MAASCNIVGSGEELLGEIIDMKDLLCRLTDAFKETAEGIVIFNDLEPMPIHDSVLQQTRDAFESSKSFRDRLVLVIQNMRLSKPPILLEGKFSQIRYSLNTC